MPARPCGQQPSGSAPTPARSEGFCTSADERLFFEPHILERITEEQEWQAPVADVGMSVGPGWWNPHIPVLRDMALRYHLEITQADGSLEDFFLTHLGEPLEQMTHSDGHTST